MTKQTFRSIENVSVAIAPKNRQFKIQDNKKSFHYLTFEQMVVSENSILSKVESQSNPFYSFIFDRVFFFINLKGSKFNSPSR